VSILESTWKINGPTVDSDRKFNLNVISTCPIIMSEDDFFGEVQRFELY